jgi:segregation and condensation protein B
VTMKSDLQVPETLEPAVGAVIFASDEPVRPKEICRALGGAELAEVEAAIDRLERHFEESPLGLRLERIAGGVRIATRTDVGPWVRHFFRERNRKRLSLAATETLAIVAYRQPITSPEIQAIRGKDPGAALSGLLDKKLIRCLGRKKVIGSPLLYGTTREFLLHFGLDRLDDLPSIEEFDQFMEVLDSQQAGAFEAAEGETPPEATSESENEANDAAKVSVAPEPAEAAPDTAPDA